MHAYGVKKSIAAVITQKEDRNEECLVIFFSKTLHNHEDRYNFIEKKVYAIMKALNKLK